MQDVFHSSNSENQITDEVGVHDELDNPHLLALQRQYVDDMRAGARDLLRRGLDPDDLTNWDHPPGSDEPPHQLLAPAAPVPEWDPDAEGDEYTYIRLANHLQAMIEAGLLQSGTRLAGERDFALQYGVSQGTVKRSRSVLQGRKLIHVLPAKGTYVC